jgi:hypothetical protein
MKSDAILTSQKATNIKNHFGKQINEQINATVIHKLTVKINHETNIAIRFE